MGDPGHGWQTVMPTSHSGMERLPQSQLEECERQILREWDASRNHWSGIGKHTPLDDFTEAKKLHTRFKVTCDTPLGSGSFGVVQKVTYLNNSRSICLARKHVRPPNRRFPVQLLREEATVMEKLDHEHIVRLVGTYCIRTDFYILMWPVAVCNLDSLLADIDNLKTGEGDREDIINRLHRLDLKDLSAVERNRFATPSSACLDNCPLTYLRQIMGCITRAVAYCHQANIRHLDLKPSNILLNPGRVYLADFGIAKDVHDRDHTMTRGQTGTPKWRAPELHQNQDDWSMKAADVYSLGMILVNIATVVHNAPLEEFDTMMGDLSTRGREAKLQAYLHKLEGLALATQEVDDVNAPTFAPKHIVSLASRMLSITASSRPVIFQVDLELVELGGIDQVYHFQCCKKSSRFVTERMNTKYKLVIDERDRLRAQRGDMAKRLEVLEAKDCTYEARITNERRAHAENIAKLQTQLDKERVERKRLEGLVAEMQQNRRPPRPGIPRPASDRQATPCSPSPGLMMRNRPRTHPLPPTASPNAPHYQRSPQPAIQQRSPAPSIGHSPRPSYSQTAAAAIAPKALTLAALPVRRDSLIPTPSPVPISGSNSSPDLAAGFPLRSRGSGSRLPRAINPATPIRSNTPNTNRDPSSTDSTQYSMSSSIFSRMSLSKASLADISVAGTPPAASSPKMVGGEEVKRPASPTALPADYHHQTEHEDQPPASPRPHHSNSILRMSTISFLQEDEHGLGLGMTDRERRESLSTVGENMSVSMRDTASVAGTLSPVLTGSALSSPRMTHAAVEAVRNGVRVPGLPTAKSWADVARRERRG
ncbi:hypothetical protein N0V88_000773 [Collariella sp. IMI 366227]|nr:hypothetical protein N0V88_000773 [Collariella sp. IMI 366227]